MSLTLGWGLVGRVFSAAGSEPTVVGVSPSTGGAAGGAHVVIQVDTSAGATSAALDGVNLTGFAIDDATHVSGNTVAHALGAVDVTVTNGVGTSAPLVNGYTYVAIVVLAIVPATGDEIGATNVVIEVDTSVGVTSAALDGTALLSFGIDDATHVSGVTDAHAAATVDVTVTNAIGTGTLTNGYVYATPWSPMVNSPTLFLTAPDYDDGEPSTNAIWTPRAHAAGTYAGTDDSQVADGAPFLAGMVTDAVVSIGETLGDLLGTGAAYHFVFVVDFNSIATTTGTSYTNAALLGENEGYFGVNVYEDEGSFYAQVTDYDGAYRYATVDISSAVPGGSGTVVLQVKKDAGQLYIKLNGGSWVAGAACGAMVTQPLGSTLRIGSSYGGTTNINGVIRAVALYDSAQNDAFADLVIPWAATVPHGWTRRAPPFDMPTVPDMWNWRDGSQMVQLTSGRILLIGGWNSDPAWSTASTNEVWANDSGGSAADWFLLLAHDDSPPTSGAGARFKPGHCIGVTTYGDGAVVISDDDQSADAWNSNSTGDVWTRVSTTAPSTSGNFMTAKLGSSIYIMGGHTTEFDLTLRTGLKTVYRSNDGGANWTTLADAPWDGRGAVWRPVVHQGWIYIVCGGTYADPIVAYNGVYRFDGTNWETILADGHGQFAAAIHVGLASVLGRLWLFNGYDGANNLRRAMTSDDGGTTWTAFAGGSGGPQSHADNVLSLPTKIIRMSGAPSERKVHFFEVL